MARVCGSRATEVSLDGLVAAFKALGKVARKSRLPAIDRTVLLEVDALQRRLSLAVTDLERGAAVALECKTSTSFRALLSPACLGAGAATLGKRADAVEGWAKVVVREGRVEVGGWPLEPAGVGEEAWPENWTWEGMWRPDRSDALHTPAPELLGALRRCRQFVADDVSKPLISQLHLRRAQGEFGKWRLEATDGHRAAAELGGGALARDLLVDPFVADALLALRPLAEESLGLRLMTYNEDVNQEKAGGLFAFLRGRWGLPLIVAARPAAEFRWSKEGTVDFPPLDRVTPGKRDCVHFVGEAGMLKNAAKAVIDLAGSQRAKNGYAWPSEHAAHVVLCEDTREVRLRHVPSDKRFLVAVDHSRLDDKGRAVDGVREIDVCFNPKYLVGLAEQFGEGERVQCWIGQNGLEPLLVEGGSGTHLLMPMRG